MFAYSLGYEDGRTEVYRLDDSSPSRRDEAWGVLDRLWSDTSIVKVMHNAKFDIKFTEVALGRRLAEDHPFEDTSLAAHLVRCNMSNKLKDLAYAIAGVPKDDEKEVQRWAKGDDDDVNYQIVPVEVMNRYQHRDALRTILLHRFFSPKVNDNPAWTSEYIMERELVIATMRMEEIGLRLNIPKTQKLIKKLDEDCQIVLDEAAEFYGTRIDLGKDMKVRRVLYEELKLPIVKRTATKMPSVDKDALQQLRDLGHAHPFLDMVQKYRSYKRGMSMLQSYIDHCDENSKVHPSIKTCGAITSRESSSKPNLQNVETEGKASNPYPVPARTVFEPEPGYVNFHIDYAAQEFRLLVHYSGDEELVDEVWREGGDPHALTAAIWYPEFPALDPKSPERKQKRDNSKGTNFAICYGAGPEKVAKVLQLPLEVVKPRYGNFKTRFPNLAGLQRTMGAFARKHGYVVNAFGRHVYLPREQAYMSVNYIIQSTGACMLKHSQVRVTEILNKYSDGNMQILLPIHDELIFRCARVYLPKARGMLRTVREAMIDFPQFKVPMEIEVSIVTRDWATKKDYPLHTD